jgi:hypothetical protein
VGSLFGGCVRCSQWTRFGNFHGCSSKSCTGVGQILLIHENCAPEHRRADAAECRRMVAEKLKVELKHFHACVSERPRLDPSYAGRRRGYVRIGTVASREELSAGGIQIRHDHTNNRSHHSSHYRKSCILRHASYFSTAFRYLLKRLTSNRNIYAVAMECRGAVLKKSEEGVFEK